MTAQLRLDALQGFREDFAALPDDRTRKMALDALVLIRAGKTRGVPLGDHVKTGDLSDCFKYYFDPDGGQKPRYHLVYRYTPDQVAAVALEAVAVGERSDLDVYLRAAAALRRAPK